MQFNGKTVVITGAASGIGAETARLFATQGAIVFASDINSTEGERLAAEEDGDIRFVKCDVCSTDDLRTLMGTAADACGGIDILVNNAGAGGSRKFIYDIEPSEWDETMNLLLRSVAFGIRYAASFMDGRPNASIINISSIAAQWPGYSPMAYSVAKAGVHHLTKVAAADLVAHKIRVNSIQPGFINTNIFTNSFNIPETKKSKVVAEIAEMSKAAQPVSRGGLPRDIAEACAYLASEAGSFVNGVSLVVDGGLTIGPRDSWDRSQPGLYEHLQAMEDGP